MSLKESQKLNEHLEKNTNLSETLEYFEKFRNMDIDPSILEHFENRILGILDKNPEANEIVNANLEKTKLQLEVVNNSYSSAFNDIIKNPLDNQNNNLAS